ncbi:hypothetical protein GCM10009630_29010 [Kribbella jejuensis]|uniref:PH (Pleckstrin Homology) domain-containing protein n=1 Tax=Kribbella jejuensis TaxID=236068 RepID=A0A542EPZ2_9ACTN|nr:hypothetical protein [Kribbella jejuensis]TQJ17403.1 hypothetical protein FB475_1521 [Kribbella jejuensis]
MPAIGDGPTEVWAAELQRSGRVVFPLRREHQLRQTRAAGVFFVLLAAVQLPPALRSGGVLRIIAIVVTTAVAVGLCVSGWQLLTQRPALTVDTSGIRLGRKRYLAWDDISGVTELDDTGDELSFAVVPAVSKRELRLTPRHVCNVAALRYWLIDVLAERRRTSAM